VRTEGIVIVPAPGITRLLVGAALATLLAGGCAGPKPVVYTPEELSVAEQTNSLEALFERAAADLQEMDPSSEAATRTRATMAEIGGRLAGQLEAEVEDALAKARLQDGLVPRDALVRERDRIRPMERWDPERFRTLSDSIAAELARTDQAIGDQRATLDDLGDDQALERLKTLEALGELTGTGTPEQSKYVEQRLAILDDMRNQATEALQKQDIDEAQRVLHILQEAGPEDASVDERLVQVDEKVFERDFWSALEQGNPDGAYAAFAKLASSSSFAALRPSLEGSAGQMASYFSTLAAGATEEGSYEDAYRWFLQAREIQAALGTEVASLGPEEEAFIQHMQAAYIKARDSKHPGLAWAYLSVIEDLSPMTPSLRRQLRETREQVVVAATRRLTAFPFSEAEGTTGDFGENIGSKVIQYLFEAIPQDVRIIEREQLANIIQERKLAGSSSSDPQALASADYLVQGNILEAKVDSTDKVGHKTLRVVTEHREERNPKHDWWLNLSAGERRREPEPPQTLEKAVTEDVKFDVTVHRKVGIFSASYRLIDAQSAKVIFADSVRRKVEHEDESNEGIELGEFSMPFKLAELPSDTEILTQLADEVSLEIGKRIAEVLKDPEETYRTNSTRLASEGNFAGASEDAAYAVVLLERKDKDAGDLRRALRQYAVAASPGL